MDQQENHPKSYDRTKTLAVKPLDGEMIKPAELIDIQGGTGLTLAARRLYNKLLSNAFGPKLAVEGHDFTISLAELRGTHGGNERIGESIEALMKTVVLVRHGEGHTTRVQLLGGNDMADSQREHGTLTYSFDKRLAPLLQSSAVFAKLELAVLQAFTTKYGLALYEAVSRRIRMSFKFSEVIAIDDFRELLGVPEGKLSSFGNLRQKAIEPAVAEVCALAPFNCSIEVADRVGRKVTTIKLAWWRKTEDELKAMHAEKKALALSDLDPLLEDLSE